MLQQQQNVLASWPNGRGGDALLAQQQLQQPSYDARAVDAWVSP